MQIPEYFQNRIRQSFGEKGQHWLDTLPEIVDICSTKWKLTECIPIEKLSINLVCFAKSPEYGEVVLKIQGPHPARYTEMKALSLYQCPYVCKCHDFDHKLGALLLERIIPGKSLTVIQNKSTQIIIAADLISKIPLPIENDQGFPSYAEWITQTFARSRKSNILEPKILFLLDTADQFFREINSIERPKMLLHGDLHHWNILQSQNGQWKVIDPHGVIGIPCMESARFILNHLELITDEKKHSSIEEMITIFSTKFTETKKVIALCSFIINVLSLCWMIEKISTEPDKLLKTINDCEFILNYINYHFT